MKTRLDALAELMINILSCAGDREESQMADGSGRIGTGETEMVVLVTPKMARQWLTEFGRKENRKTNRARVEGYVALMKAQRWLCSGEHAISFDTTGTILNGHHRLQAVIDSGLTIAFVIRRNVDPKVLRYTDTHQRRTPGQIARMFGDDTRWDPALRVVFLARNKSSGARCHDLLMEELRNEFALAAISAGPASSIKVAGRFLNAGARAGVLVCAKHEHEHLAPFLTDLRGAADRSIVGHKASRNLIQWIENHRGASSGGVQALDSMAALVNAFDQFRGEGDKDCVRSLRGVSFARYIK